jgi:hypothetical protein
MLISEIDRVIKEVFDAEKGVVKSVDTVYEEPSDHKDHLNLVISIHKLSVEETIIIHTKFIFKTDLEKINLKHNIFSYLHDINCEYINVSFTDVSILKEKLTDIIKYNKFGRDLKILSEFIDTPAKRINAYFANNKVTKYSVINVEYTPASKICPCEEITFDFKIDMGNDYIFYVKMRKEDKKNYKFTFKFFDHQDISTVDNIMNLHAIIGGKIVEMLDKYLK